MQERVESMPRDYYEVLGVDRGASQNDLKRAFRQLAREYHPDVNNSTDAQQRFQEINEAYQVLSDEDKRSAYDRFGHAGVNAAGGFGGFNGFSGGFDDLFSDIFSAFTGTRTQSRRGPRQGRDLRYDLTLSFEEAVFGTEAEIEVTRHEFCDTCNGSGAAAGSAPKTCQHCNGRGQVRQSRSTFLGSIVNVTDCPVCRGTGQIIENPCSTCHGAGLEHKTKPLTVAVPPGVDDGIQIRVSGQGEPGEKNGPAGNLYVVISVEPHDYFQRRGNDIILDIPINVAQATLGDIVTIPTIDGESDIQVKPGTQTGTVIRLKESGVPKLRRDGTVAGRGDQMVVLNVEVPSKLTDRQRELFEELADTLGTDVKPQKAGKGLFERMAGFFGNE